MSGDIDPRAALKRLAEINRRRLFDALLDAAKALTPDDRAGPDSRGGLADLLNALSDAGLGATDTQLVLNVAMQRTGDRLSLSLLKSAHGPHELVRAGDSRECQLVEFRPEGSMSVPPNAARSPILGWATVLFRSGRRIGAIPISLSADGRLLVGVHMRSGDGRRWKIASRSALSLPFESAEVRQQWKSDVLCALEAGLVEGGAS